MNDTVIHGISPEITQETAAAAEIDQIFSLCCTHIIRDHAVTQKILLIVRVCRVETHIGAEAQSVVPQNHSDQLFAVFIAIQIGKECGAFTQFHYVAVGDILILFLE